MAKEMSATMAIKNFFGMTARQAHEEVGKLTVEERDELGKLIAEESKGEIVIVKK